MSETDDPVKASVRDIMDDMVELDITFDHTREQRQSIYNKLKMTLDKLDIDVKDDSETMSSKLQVFNTATSVLNDMDKQIRDKISLKSKVKLEESEVQHSKAITEQFSKLIYIEPTSNSDKTNITEIDDNVISEKLKNNNLTISETELREDSKDIS